MKMYRLRHLLIDESCQYFCALDCDSFFCLVCCEITVTLQQPIILYLAWYEYALFDSFGIYNVLKHDGRFLSQRFDFCLL